MTALEREDVLFPMDWKKCSLKLFGDFTWCSGRMNPREVLLQRTSSEGKRLWTGQLRHRPKTEKTLQNDAGLSSINLFWPFLTLTDTYKETAWAQICSADFCNCKSTHHFDIKENYSLVSRNRGTYFTITFSLVWYWLLKYVCLALGKGWTYKNFLLFGRKVSWFLSYFKMHFATCECLMYWTLTNVSLCSTEYTVFPCKVELNVSRWDDHLRIPLCLVGNAWAFVHKKKGYDLWPSRKRVSCGEVFWGKPVGSWVTRWGK